jgi:hypothetical protein
MKPTIKITAIRHMPGFFTNRLSNLPIIPAGLFSSMTVMTDPNTIFQDTSTLNYPLLTSHK